jgi:hypothetical protein
LFLGKKAFNCPVINRGECSNNAHKLITRRTLLKLRREIRMKEVEKVERKEVRNRPNNLGNWLKTGGKGRVPGSKNRITANIKADIEAVFKMLGGRKSMAEWAKRSDKNRALFYRMVVSILPKELAVSAKINHSTGLEKLSDEELIAIIKRGGAMVGETIDETKLIKEGSPK